MAKRHQSIRYGFEASGIWAVLLAVASAPWASGGLQREEITVAESLVGAGLVLWLTGWILRRKPPPLPFRCIVPMLILLFVGWGMTLHPRSFYSWQRHALILPINADTTRFGTVDFTTSFDSMTRITALIAALCIITYAAHQDAWRRRLFVTLALNGTAIILCGILQRLGMTSPHRTAVNDTFGFSTFGYHGNAGAFINLVIPSVFGLMLMSTQGSGTRGWNRLQTAVWSFAIVVCIAGALINTSRAAQAITLFELCMFTVYAWRTTRTNLRRPQFKFNWRFLLIPLAAALIALAAGGMTAWRRWSDVGQALGIHGSRMTLWRISWHMARRAGPFGFGPGTFKIVLPLAPDIATLYSLYIVTWHVPGQAVSMWSNAHEDYLQTIIEWGWLGALGWALLLFGGPARGVLALARKSPQIPATERTFLFCAVVATSATFLHSLVDFPLQVLSIQLYIAGYLGICWSSACAIPASSIASSGHRVKRSEMRTDAH
jgi:hypothetical protein